MTRGDGAVWWVGAVDAVRWARHQVRLLRGDMRAWPILTASVVLVVVSAAAAVNDAASMAASGGAWGVGEGVAVWIGGTWAYALVLTPIAVVGLAGAWWYGWSAAFRTSYRRDRWFHARLWRRRFTTWWLWLLVIGVLVASWSTVTNVVAGVLLAATVLVTDVPRARARTCRWLLSRLAAIPVEVVRAPGDVGWRLRQVGWRGKTPLRLEVSCPPDIRESQDTVRERVEAACVWALRRHGEYTATHWIPGSRTVVVELTQGVVTLPEAVTDRRWPAELPGVVLGVTTPSVASAVIQYDTGESVPVVCWDPDAERDLLIAGVKGGGKTTLSRGLVVRSLANGAISEWYLLDGKSSGDYAALEQRDGIVCVARDPVSWGESLQRVISEMETRYHQAWLYESGQIDEQPEWPRIGLLIDEITNVRDELRPEVFDPLMRKLGRMARAARITTIAATQRPDVKEALPGATKDQFEDRIVAGWLSQVGAEMMLGTDWRYVTETEEWPRGRAVARIAGRLCRFQVPDLGSPVRDAHAASLYPPRLTTAAPTPAGAGESKRRVRRTG